MKVFSLAKIAPIVTLFCVAAAIAAHAQTFTSLHIFKGGNGNGPQEGLVQGTDGNFYGATAFGGIDKAGNIFRMTPSGEITSLYRFCTQSGCPDGDSPRGSLVQLSNGNFYGTTFAKGSGAHCPPNSDDCGTVFEITPAGKLTTLYNFCSQAKCADGNNPNPLVVGTDGNLYGTTVGYNGAPSCVGTSATGCGTVFRITPTGKMTVLHQFCSENNCNDGYGPFAALTLGTDGNFYGTTVYGGTNNWGTAFKITPQGTFTTLYAFCSETNCADGSQPQAPLVQASSGNFYGTASDGGANINCNDNSIGCGTIFEITPKGELTTLYNFCPVSGCVDGYYPFAALSLGTDGNFYGTTGLGGTNNYGTIFELTSDGKFSTLFTFSCTSQSCNDGASPNALVQGTDGTFYGTTDTGGKIISRGNLGAGVTFSWSMGLGAFVKAQFNFGKAGSVVHILGNNLTGTTGVTFNGTAAKFQVVSGTYIRAQVPAGATTGTIEVTTSSGTLKSNVAFQVLP